MNGCGGGIRRSRWRACPRFLLSQECRNDGGRRRWCPGHVLRQAQHERVRAPSTGSGRGQHERVRWVLGCRSRGAGALWQRPCGRCGLNIGRKPSITSTKKRMGLRPPSVSVRMNWARSAFRSAVAMGVRGVLRRWDHPHPGPLPEGEGARRRRWCLGRAREWAVLEPPLRRRGRVRRSCRWHHPHPGPLPEGEGEPSAPADWRRDRRDAPLVSGAGASAVASALTGPGPSSAEAMSGCFHRAPADRLRKGSARDGFEGGVVVEAEPAELARGVQAGARASCLVSRPLRTATRKRTMSLPFWVSSRTMSCMDGACCVSVDICSMIVACERVCQEASPQANSRSIARLSRSSRLNRDVWHCIANCSMALLFDT